MTGTQGSCNVTTPKALISGAPVVFIDNSEIALTYIENATHHFIYFTFLHSTHHVTVGGSQTISEFPKAILPIVLLAAMVLVTTRLRKQNGSTRVGKKTNWIIWNLNIRNVKSAILHTSS